MNKYLLPGAALMGLVSANARGATCTTIDPGSTPCTFSQLAASASNPAPPGSTGPLGGPLGPYNPIDSPTGVGGIGGPVDFAVSSAGTLIMTVEPSVGEFPGDVYQAFVDGSSLGLTTPVPLFGSQPSTGTFTTPISAGPHNFDINDQILSYIGFPSPYGSNATFNTVPATFSPSGVTVILEELPSAVPEPGSLALIGAWLLGLGFLRYLRRTI